MKKQLAITALLLSSALAGAQAFGAERTGAVKDAWITGKIDAVYLLNSHLSPFKIETDTTAGKVHLTGTVENAIDKDLAGELAKGVEGVVSVDNDLTIETTAKQARAAAKDGDRPFGVWVDDATTTAAVKSKLLANPNTHGIKIDVDTRNDIVTLSGTVKSDEEKQLAGELAKNTGDVKQVKNQLVVNRAG